jgi:hypothetical protein
MGNLLWKSFTGLPECSDDTCQLVKLFILESVNLNGTVKLNKNTNTLLISFFKTSILIKNNHLTTLTQHNPFKDAFEWISNNSVNPAKVLWVMPRIEILAQFRHYWAQQNPNQSLIGPWVQTADRLSQPAAMAPWLSLQADLVGVFRETSLIGAGASGTQLWSLAQEYLELAMRLVLLQNYNTSPLANYAQSNSFAAKESLVIFQLAQTYHAELMALVPKAAVYSHQMPEYIVWFDDGEAVPGYWLKKFYPNVPIQVFKLNAIENPQPWQELVRARFGEHANSIVLHVAPDETTQAQQAAHQILEWLSENSEDEITVAVIDRLAARRLIGLLADVGVLVDDRTGWRLSTSNVAGWFDQLLQQYIERGQLIEIVRPFTGFPIENVEPWVFGGADEPHTLSQWALAFCRLFERYDIEEALYRDEAGEQLLCALSVMRQSTSQTVFDAHEFQTAWRSLAESLRFRPQDIESPVRMVPLLSTRMCRFNRVLVLGCAQSHFQESPPSLLPPSVAQEFGFSKPRLARIQKISALYELLMYSNQVTLLHSAEVAGRPEMLLSELTWLDLLLRKVDGLSHEWSSVWHRTLGNFEMSVSALPEQPLKLKALQEGKSVPNTLRVTALDDWVACSLRFGLKHVLPWSQQRDLGSKSYEQLRGNFIHKVLERTAYQMAQAGQGLSELKVWKKVLLDQAQGVWERLEFKDRAIIYPFLKFFGQIVPRVAGKLMERQIQGWQFKAAEKEVVMTLKLQPSGYIVNLKGRIDRLDQRDDSLAIADIKFTNPTVLRKRLEQPLSQPQLPAYQVMLNHQSTQLDFLGLHSDNVDWVTFPSMSDDWKALGFLSWGDVLVSQLSTDLDHFFSGQVEWNASPGEACRWCDVKGICRPNGDMVTGGNEEDDESFNS